MLYGQEVESLKTRIIPLYVRTCERTHSGMGLYRITLSGCDICSFGHVLYVPSDGCGGRTTIASVYESTVHIIQSVFFWLS